MSSSELNDHDDERNDDHEEASSDESDDEQAEDASDHELSSKASDQAEQADDEDHGDDSHSQTTTMTTPGRNTANYQRLAAQLRAETERRGWPCWLCRQPIPCPSSPGDPSSFSVDHVQPLSTHPWLAEEWTNFRPAHLRCNTGRGNRPPPADLGVPSRSW